MASYLSVTDLVTRAKNGEQQAWDALVERVLIADSIPDTETDTVEQELLVAEQHAVQRVRSRPPAPATAL